MENGKKNWWLEGVRLAGDISSSIVVPVVLALIFGKILDARYGTKPILLLSCLAFGFIVTVYGIVKSIKGYTRRIDREKQ